MNHSFATALDWLDGQDEVTARTWLTNDAGVDPASEYVELYWLPIVGPSATWALRRIAPALQAAPDGRVELKLDVLARSIGVSRRTGRQSPIKRTLARLVERRLAGVDVEADELAVRVVVPLLDAPTANRLPAYLRPLHRALLDQLATTLPEGADA